jgi:hypothetical protein
VLGARTQKCADYLDACAALTGRVPLAGVHLDAQRVATVVLDVSALVRSAGPGDGGGLVRDVAGLAGACGDAFFPALGYLCGLVAEARVPVVVGLEGLAPGGASRDHLKAFSAAFGSTASVPLFHMVGHTPEALTVEQALGHAPPLETVRLTPTDLATVWVTLNSGKLPPKPLKATRFDSEEEEDEEDEEVEEAGEVEEKDEPIELVALGSPHLSLSECAALAALCAPPPPAARRVKHPGVRVVATLGRQVLAQADAAGYAPALRRFGVELVTDTCWCMLHEPVVPVNARIIVTNSAKYKTPATRRKIQN